MAWFPLKIVPLRFGCGLQKTHERKGIALIGYTNYSSIGARQATKKIIENTRKNHCLRLKKIIAHKNILII